MFSNIKTIKEVKIPKQTKYQKKKLNEKKAKHRPAYFGSVPKIKIKKRAIIKK